MIVRNEGRAIRRLLDSVRDLVDEYVIVDTGSTDDTVAQIEAHPLKGVVVHQPFVNFGVSRTFALEQARLHSKCDYLLLLDADMELRHPCRLPALAADAYYVAQRQGTLLYDNIRLLRRELEATCVGSTHEFYRLPHGSIVSRIPEDDVFIVDHGDGGCKSDKFERDIRLLEQELREDPTNPRTVFYLAQSLYDTQRYVRAMNMYMQRIALGGWEQEVVYSKFRVALCHVGLQNWKHAQEWTRIAQEAAAASGHPRAEPAYYMCKALREKGDYGLAYYFLLQAQRIPKPSASGCLFVEEAVYDFMVDFERCVLWYYVHPSPLLLPQGLDLSLDFLKKPGVPADILHCVLRNLVFYIEPLAAHGKPRRIYEDEFLDATHEWRYSTPGFLRSGTLYTRLVNFRLDESGEYHTQKGAAIASRLLVGNVVIQTIRNETPWHHPNAPVLGLEDTRIIETDGGDLYTLSASREYSRKFGDISQVLGKLDVEERSHIILKILESPLQQAYEKNWVAAGSLEKIIYRWHPDIWVGRIDVVNGTLLHTHSLASPASFLGMRGSTNGVFYENLWWFVTHNVVGEPHTLRKYFHRLVALNEDLTEIEKVSRPFVFEPHADVEYCLGLSISGNMARFGYSVRDRLPRTLVVPLLALL